VFLHGLDEAAPLAIESALTRHGPLRAESRALVVDRFVVIAPQLPIAGDRWIEQREPLGRIAASIDRFGGDRARLFLAGFSYGGNGVLDVALAMPEPWAALWAVDPTRPPSSPPGRPLWLSIGGLARRRRDEFLGATGARAIADDDAFVPQDVNVALDQGEDHVGCATSAFSDGRIYAWLLARPRSSR
jgi:hypothetical protein